MATWPPTAPPPRLLLDPCTAPAPVPRSWMEYRVISIYMDLWDVGLLKNFRLAWWRKIPEWGWTP